MVRMPTISYPFPQSPLCGPQRRRTIRKNDAERILTGTPTKRQVSKRQVSKRPVSKRLKPQVYKTSGLQKVRFTKCKVYKMSGLKNVRLQKPSMYILYLWLVEIRRFCCSHVCRQSDGCFLFSISEVFCHISP